MASKNSKRGLGKGIHALFPDTVLNEEKKAGIKMVKLEDISPNPMQPRREFNNEKLAELAQSIKTHGVIQPLVLQERDAGFEIIAGERRWRAAKIAGLKTVPAIVQEHSKADTMEIALIENLQREDLNPLEEAEAYKILSQEHGLTQEELSARIGKSRSHIANMLRLLNLPAAVRENVSRETISMGHARALLGLPSETEQVKALGVILQRNLSVRGTEELIRGMMAQKRKTKRQIGTNKKDPHIVYIENTLQETLGTKVEITTGSKKNKIEIEYYGDEDLERIFALLGITL